MPIFPTPKTEIYSSEFLEKALEVMEPQAVWLLLSIDHYGWRAHADLAHSLIGSGPPEPGPDDMAQHHFEHRVMGAVEELFLLFDQVWRLVDAIRSHRSGSRFLESYCSHGGNLARKIELLGRMDEDEWAELLRTPTDEEIRDQGAWSPGLADDGDWWVEYKSEVLRLCVVNMGEITAFFDRPQSPIEGFVETSFRDTNNAYRHGTRILYEDCSPADSGWISANPEHAVGLLLPAKDAVAAGRGRVVNVLQALPDADGRAQLAAVPIETEWCDSLIAGMGHLSVLLQRLARSFLLAEALGTRPLSSIADLEWTPLG